MDKITFENLPSETTAVSAENMNLMQNNIEKSANYIGSTQPSTGEKVWLKTGKNLFNKNNVINGYRFGSDGALYAESGYSATDYIEVSSNTQYTVSWVIQIVQCVCYYDENKNFIARNGSENPFTTPANCKYIRASVSNSGINSAQIEQGSTATTYEPYIDKEIRIKNSNGVFEKFYHEDFFQNDNYKCGEYKIGTWVDGKPLYKKTIVIQNTAFSNGDNTVAHRVSNLKQCFKAELAKNGSNIFPYLNVSGSSVTVTIISNVDNTNITIRCINDTWGSGNVWFATLYYTKTTD